DRRFDVLHRLVEAEFGHVLAAFGDGVGRVAQLHAGPDMVEEARRKGEIALLGELVGHRLDVMVDPEDFLDDHDTALGRAGREGEVGADFAALGLKTNIFTHENSSRLQWALDMVLPRRSTHRQRSRAMYIPKAFEGSEPTGREI